MKQNQLRVKKQMKRCHENRTLKCLRKKYRSKGINEQQELVILLNNHQATSSSQQHNLPIPHDNDNNEGEIHDSYTKNTKDDINNMSILFKNQEDVNEHQSEEQNLTDESPISSQLFTTGEWVSPQTIKYETRFKRCNLSSDHWKQYSKLIPNYKHLSSNQFKYFLMTSIPMNDRHMIEQFLNNFILLQCFQQRAELMCTVSQLEIEQNYWNYVINLLNTPIGIWLSEISIDITKNNFINWDHTKTKINIKRRQELIERKFIDAKNKLALHLQQPYPWYSQFEDQYSNDYFIDIISNGLDVLVKNSLYYLRLNFEQKRILLEFDISGAKLVKSLYDLNPNEKQISTIQDIWRIKMKSCRRAIRQKKKKHSVSIGNLITAENTDQSQENKLLSIASLDPNIRTICENRLINIKERAQQLMAFNNTIIDHTFFKYI